MGAILKFEEKTHGTPYNVVAFYGTGCRFSAKWKGKTGVCGIFSNFGTTVPMRGNSPSILEGVAVGRGSNTKHQNSL